MFKTAINEEIKVPANVDYLGDLRNFVTKAGRKHDFPATVVNAFKLCIDEAATNIIKHAYRDWEGMITMRVIIKTNSMTVVLIDQGKYFDPARVADPDLQRYVNIGKKGGLGIFIMRKLLDEIDYHRTEEGNELRLTKFRDRSAPKKKVVATPSVSATLKTRFSALTAGVLALVVALVYLFYFVSHAQTIFNEFVAAEKVICDNIARLVWGENDVDFNHIDIATNITEFIKDKKEIHKVIVTNLENFIEYSTDEGLAFTEFKIPPEFEQPRPGLMSYKDENGETIYSFVRDVYNSEIEKTKVGTVHVQVKKDFVSHQIAKQRLKDLQVAFLVLLFSYLGTAILIYFVMNPFRKLANWVKDLGTGNVQDEIDFDRSGEAGEIAQAFSEITDKFRESQKNLAEQERIKKEMQVAQEIQQTLLPSEVPMIEGYEIASYYEAAKEVGGDYFDFVEVDKDTLGIVVADVSGKGLPGALIMTMIRTVLRTEARLIKSASEVLARLNDIVVKDMKKGMFVTLFYVIIDSKKRRINYASAGHNPMILYRQGTQKTYYLNPRGFPVGISLPDTDLFKNSIESDTIQLTEDDILIIYTDGITEAMNNRRDMFSEERLLDVIRKNGNLRAEEFIEKLKDEIHSFAEGFEQSDDITVVAIKENSTPEKIELTRAQNAHQVILKGKSIRDACEESGITTYAYYNKYKKVFDQEGVDAYSIDETVSVEAKHLSIEEKTKIYDIIKKHPEYGAKRISEELCTELYGRAKINESRIYDELVRSRLNTKQLREAFISRGGRKKRLKPPGTPMLTLDGRIILDQRFKDFKTEQTAQPAQYERKPAAEKIEKPIEAPKQETIIPKEPDDNFYLESLMTMPLEDLLKKPRKSAEKGIPKEAPETARDEENETPSEPPVDSFEEDEEESIDEDVVAEPEEEPILDDLPASELDTDEEPTTVHVIDEVQLEKPYDKVEEIGIDHDFSFRDIWDEQTDDLELETESEDEKYDQTIKLPESEISGDSESTPASDSDAIDDLLDESGEREDISFEMLTEDASFKDEMLLKKKGDNGELGFENESIAESETEEESSGADRYNEIDPEKTKKPIPETAKKVSDPYKVDEEDLLAEEKIATDDFSFDDLLEEIESDISLLNRHEYAEKETELVYNTPRQVKPPKQIFPTEGSTSRKRQSSDGSATTTSQPASVNRLREKHLILGLKYYQEKNYEQAVEQFVRVVQKYPDFKEAFSILGNAYYRNNQSDLAIKSYQRVKQLDPFDVDAYENIGVIYANIGNFEDAIKEWKTLLEIKPDRQDIVIKIKRAKELIAGS